jgi:hypothetical protein
MNYLDFRTVSGPATGSEVTYFDAVMSIVLTLFSRDGTDLRMSFDTMEQTISLRFMKHKCGEFLNQSEWSLIRHVYINRA